MNRNGFSLVELMVALLLGSLISIAATQLFLVNRQADNLQQGLSSIQDQGRFIVDYLSRDLMQAGHHPDAAIDPFVFAATEPRRSVDDPRHDTLVMQVNNGAGCQGDAGFTGVKRYRVDAARNLICADFRLVAGAWQPGNSETLIDNVEAFQVLYGVDFDTSLGQSGYGYADAYADATSVALAPQRIVSVRFAVLLSSDRPAGVDASLAPASVPVLDQDIGSDAGVTLDDRRIYRVFTSTVALRNQVGL
jgi:type IV pilus assembly protein PilW